MEKRAKVWEKIKAMSGMDRLAALIAIVAIVLVAMTVYPWFKPDTTPTLAPETGAQGTPDEENRLAGILSTIDGAGRVRVMISYASGPERIPISDVDRQTSNEVMQDAQGSNRTVTTTTEATRAVTVGQQGGNDALLLVEKKPEVLGVIVVCDGARDVRVKISVLDAVMTVLGVPADRVQVFPMQKQVSMEE